MWSWLSNACTLDSFVLINFSNCKFLFWWNISFWRKPRKRALPPPLPGRKLVKSPKIGSNLRRSKKIIWLKRFSSFKKNFCSVHFYHKLEFKFRHTFILFDSIDVCNFIKKYFLIELKYALKFILLFSSWQSHENKNNSWWKKSWKIY